MTKRKVLSLFDSEMLWFNEEMKFKLIPFRNSIPVKITDD